MALNKLGAVIMGFVLIIVGTILLDSLADNVYAATTLSPVINETVVTSSNAGQTTNDDVSAVTEFQNATDTFAINTLVNVTRAGVISVNGSIVDGSYNITYTYEDDPYVVDSVSRTTINLIPMLFALSIVIGGFVMVKIGFDL